MLFRSYAGQSGKGGCGEVHAEKRGVDEHVTVKMGIVKHTEKEDKNRHLKQKRQTAAGRIDFMLFIKRHHLAGLPLFVVFIFGLEFLNLGLKDLHRFHGFDAFEGERENNNTKQNGEDDDAPTVTVGNIVCEEPKKIYDKGS